MDKGFYFDFDSFARYLMDTIISLQPRTGGAGGGKSSDEVLLISNLFELVQRLKSLHNKTAGCR